jgi:hypothetical protein
LVVVVVVVVVVFLVVPDHDVVVALLQPHHHHRQTLYRHHNYCSPSSCLVGKQQQQQQQQLGYGNRIAFPLFGEESDDDVSEIGTEQNDDVDLIIPTSTSNTEEGIVGEMYFAAKQEQDTTTTTTTRMVRDVVVDPSNNPSSIELESDDVTNEEFIILESPEYSLADTEDLEMEEEDENDDGDMEESLMETLDVTDEMEIVMEDMEDASEEALSSSSASSVPPPPQPENLAETTATDTTVVATKQVTKTKIDDDNSAAVDLLESIGGAAMSVTLDILSGLRWAAATALTASLPENQRSELLNRMTPTTKRSTLVGNEREEEEEKVVTASKKDVVEEMPTRGSVQEEIAAAVVEETRNNKAKWEKEKESLMTQMEEAANERVKNELAIQKIRLEKEQETALLAIEAEKNDLEIQKMLLEKSIDTGNEITELESLLTKRQQQQEALASIEEALQIRVSKIDTEKERLSQIEAEVEKREQQQSALDALEEDLRKRISEIEAEKERLAKLEIEIAEVRERQPQEAASDEDDNNDDDDVEGSQTPYLSAREYRALSDEEKATLREQRDAIRSASNAESGSDVHPVLGPIISDLGYKRIHLVSSGKLGTLPVWNKNRIYRNDRAKSMAAEKMKSMHLGFPGVICVHEEKDGKLSILDGQHRVGMMAAIRAKRNKDSEASGTTFADDFMFDQILVEVYPQGSESSEKYAEEIFTEINKAEPVKL